MEHDWQDLSTLNKDTPSFQMYMWQWLARFLVCSRSTACHVNQRVVVDEDPKPARSNTKPEKQRHIPNSQKNDLQVKSWFLMIELSFWMIPRFWRVKTSCLTVNTAVWTVQIHATINHRQPPSTTINHHQPPSTTINHHQVQATTHCVSIGELETNRELSAKKVLFGLWFFQRRWTNRIHRNWGIPKWGFSWQQLKGHIALQTVDHQGSYIHLTVVQSFSACVGCAIQTWFLGWWTFSVRGIEYNYSTSIRQSQ